VSAELIEVERAKQAARPWLYGPDVGAGDLGGAAHKVEASPIGVPIAVKIGVSIGQARRREHLTAATAHANAACQSGMIGRDVFDALTEAILEKQAGLAWHRQWWNRNAPPRILKRVENNRRPRIEHRAKLAASGPMPPDLAKKFTVGELSVMKIVADEVALRATCRLTKAEMSDRAQASETTVHNAIRKAHSLGMLDAKQRSVPWKKNLPNLIIVIDPDWRLWIARPKYRAIREDREKGPETQGANRSTSQSVQSYKKNRDGVWRDQAVAEEEKKFYPLVATLHQIPRADRLRRMAMTGKKGGYQ
jgi:hypothetical protein